MWDFSAYCDAPWNGLPDETVVPDAFERFVASPYQSRLLIEVQARSLAAQPVTDVGAEPYCEFAWCDTAGARDSSVVKTFFFSNGKFAGRPDDRIRANRRYQPRVLNSADIERSLPQSPAEQAGALSIGSIDLANPDGALDFLADEWTVANCNVVIRMVRAGGYVHEGKIIGVFSGDVFERTLDRLTIRLKSVSDYLARPLHLAKYTGAGGINGDASIAGRVRPVCYGPCFNVPPVLIDQANWIYQVNDGRIFAVDAVRDAGLDLVNDGDVASYRALVQTEVAGGHYLTCKDLGIFKAGFGVAGPAGEVRADVRGDTDQNGTYTADLGDILLRIAINCAGIGSEFLNRPSFGQLPKADVCFYSDAEQTCADAFRYFLGGVFGWFSPDRSNLLAVGIIRPPEDGSPAYVLDDKLALNIEEVSVNWTPLYQQSVAYNRNWGILTDDQLSDLVGSVPGSATRSELTSNGATEPTTSSGVRIRRLDAKAGDLIQSPFVGAQAQAAAAEVGARVLAVNSEARHLFRVETHRFSLLLNQQRVVTLQNNRFGLKNGKNGVVMSLRDSGAGEGGSVLLLV